MEFDLALSSYIAIAAIVVFAYAVFGLTGFGSAMVGVPLLVQIVPLSVAVPLVVLMDIVSTSLVGWRSRRNFDRIEFTRIVPAMLAGIAFGATVLATFKPRWLLIGLGLFVLGNAAWTLLSKRAVQTPIHPFWAIPAGLVGGMFGAAFGAGGPVYTIYLARRIEDPDRFRATIVAVVFISGALRLSAFLFAGLLDETELLLTALLMLPFSLLGSFIGSRLRRQFDAHTLKLLLFIFLLFGGAAVLTRALFMPS